MKQSSGLQNARIKGYNLVTKLQQNENIINEVFLAKSKQDEKVFVVFKIFNNYIKQAIEKIYNEQKKGKCQNIIRVEDYFTSEFLKRQYYFVILRKADQNLLEFYEKFSDMSQQKQENLKLQIMTQVTKGVKELHENKIIHRDIKPENILMIGENAYIGDLGLIKVLSKKDSPSRINAIGYSAPELYTSGKNYTFSVDVYSLGRLFLYILFGEPDEKALETNLQVKNKFGGLILQMIEINPNQRPTLTNILNKLQELDETQKVEDNIQKKQKLN